jgi:hypothetical protein
MILPGNFKLLIDSIEALGFDRETARFFARQIGDTPVIDEDGKVIVEDRDGTVVKLALDY